MTSDRKRIIYDGEFERGRMHGRGTYYYSSGVTSGSKQHVTVEDGKSKKKGNAGTAATSISDIQSYYEGEFRDGAR